MCASCVAWRYVTLASAEEARESFDPDCGKMRFRAPLIGVGLAPNAKLTDDDVAEDICARSAVDRAVQGFLKRQMVASSPSIVREEDSGGKRIWPLPPNLIRRTVLGRR